MSTRETRWSLLRSNLYFQKTFVHLLLVEHVYRRQHKSRFNLRFLKCSYTYSVSLSNRSYLVTVLYPCICTPVAEVCCRYMHRIFLRCPSLYIVGTRLQGVIKHIKICIYFTYLMYTQTHLYNTCSSLYTHMVKRQHKHRYGNNNNRFHRLTYE